MELARLEKTSKVKILQEKGKKAFSEDEGVILETQKGKEILLPKSVFRGLNRVHTRWTHLQGRYPSKKVDAGARDPHSRENQLILGASI